MLPAWWWQPLQDGVSFVWHEAHLLVQREGKAIAAVAVLSMTTTRRRQARRNVVDRFISTVLSRLAGGQVNGRTIRDYT
jgi:hypothetical protein